MLHFHRKDLNKENAAVKNVYRIFTGDAVIFEVNEREKEIYGKVRLKDRLKKNKTMFANMMFEYSIETIEFMNWLENTCGLKFPAFYQAKVVCQSPDTFDVDKGKQIVTEKLNILVKKAIIEAYNDALRKSRLITRELFHMKIRQDKQADKMSDEYKQKFIDN